MKRNMGGEYAIGYCTTRYSPRFRNGLLLERGKRQVDYILIHGRIE